MNHSEGLNTAIAATTSGTACVASAVAYDYGSAIMFGIAILGALVSACTLVWTIYSSNRQFRLQQEAHIYNLEQARLERAATTKVLEQVIEQTSGNGAS